MAEIELDEGTAERRAEIARRLKAGRWLAGGLRGGAMRGKTGYEVTALSPKELADRPPLAENEITATKLGAIERMERHATPMELERIALGLGMPADYFRQDRDENHARSITQMLQEQTELLREIRRLADALPSDETTRRLTDAVRGGDQPLPQVQTADAGTGDAR